MCNFFIHENTSTHFAFLQQAELQSTSDLLILAMKNIKSSM